MEDKGISIAEAFKILDVLEKDSGHGEQISQVRELLESLDSERKRDSGLRSKMDYFQKGFLRLIRLFSDLEIIPQNPELFFHHLLTTIMALVPEADYGALSLITKDSWRFIAAVGHDLGGLLRLDLKPEWDLSQNGIEIISNVPGVGSKTRSQIPSEIRKDLLKALKPSRWILLGGAGIGEDLRLAISLEISWESTESFSNGSMDIFRGLLNLAGTYYQLVNHQEALEMANKSLRDSNRNLEHSLEEIQRLTRKLAQVLNLTGRLGDEFSGMEFFYNELVRTALLVVDEADYGSISLISPEAVEYLSAVGHDIQALRKLRIPPQQMRFSTEPTIIKNPEKNSPTMDPEVRNALLASTSPIKSTMTITLDVDGHNSVCLSLDIRRESEKEFSDNSKRVFQSFASLASSFLKVRMSTEVVKQSSLNFANKLAIVAEIHDRSTAEHNLRVANIASFIADKAGLEPRLVEDIKNFAPLHDIGKIFLKSDLINKAGKLTAEEYAKVQEHTQLAQSLLDDPFFIVAKNIAVHHHEKFDGSGYPKGLSGDAIPKEAQVVSVADVYDALRSKRSYKEGMSSRAAIDLMKSGDDRISPSHFNPLYLKLLERFEDEINQRFYP